MTFDDLCHNHCAIIDGHTAEMIRVPSLSQKSAVGIDRKIDCGAYADFLARLTIYDSLVVDRRAIKCLNVDITESFEPIRVLDIPEEVYSEVAEKLLDCIAPKLSPKRVAWMNDDRTNQKWFDQSDKDYIDFLAKHTNARSVGGSFIADSANSSVRTFFYVELSRLAGVPLLVSERKQRFLDQFRAKLLPELFPKLEREIDKRLFQATEKLFGSYDNPLLRIPISPLGDFILRLSTNRGISPIEAVETARQMASGKAFRQWLKKLQKATMSGDRVDLLAVQADVGKVLNTVDGWAKEMDVEVGVTKEKREFALKAIPVAGWIAELTNFRGLSQMRRTGADSSTSGRNGSKRVATHVLR